jgi:F-type H+-transporting ATPase subunit epsilon
MLHDQYHAGLEVKTFQIVLRDSTHSENIDDVTSFIGEDKSGSFGIKANHSRMMTSLVFGLARFKTENEPWQYLAMPGAILYFVNNSLKINTRRYIKSENYTKITRSLLDTLTREEEELAIMKGNLRNIEAHILKRMLEMNKA